MHRVNEPDTGAELDRDIDFDEEREVDLSDDPEPAAPSTIDPDERVEVVEDDPEIAEGDGPRAP